MLHANPKTRRQNSTAGESVDVEGYLRKMADNATDGDHLTLQVRLVYSLCVWTRMADRSIGACCYCYRRATHLF